MPKQKPGFRKAIPAYPFLLFNKIIVPDIPGENKDSLIENINFNALLFSAFLFSFISSLFNFTEGFDVILNIFTIFCSLVFAYLYYQSRFKNYYNIWITTVTTLLLLSFIWFMDGGTIGSTAYIYILALIILIIISKRHQQNRIFLLFISNMVTVYVFEYCFGTRLIHPYPSQIAYYSDIIFVFLLVLVSVFFLTRFIKRAFDDEKDKVNLQKEIIEEKNTELLSSITYASYLQKRIISDENKLHALFNDYFVLFKPRDIVSGDFFWDKEKGNYGIVVAGDCTGHGVPAAFLGILGISLFEEIIIQEGEVLDAAVILEKVRTKFIAYLSRNDSGSEMARDGIDLSICIVDYPNYTFQFSGANRSLFMIRSNNQPENKYYSEKETAATHTLYTFKGTKNTIGFNYRELPFVNYKIKFNPDDTFYVFSDGYSDQFDSHNKKKFNSRQLKHELLKIQDLPMPTQGDYLDSLHKKWKGKTSQTDDILIIGLRM